MRGDIEHTGCTGVAVFTALTSTHHIFKVRLLDRLTTGVSYLGVQFRLYYV